MRRTWPLRIAKAYEAAEDAAKSAKLGLWKDASPTPPWDFRASERKATDTQAATAGTDSHISRFLTYTQKPRVKKIHRGALFSRNQSLFIPLLPLFL